jgi:HlyD family secretion protein
MIQKYLLPLLAILGALLGLVMVAVTQAAVPIPPIPFPPATPPYRYSIAGAGIIEASSNNLAIGSPFDEIVSKIHVVEGMFVKKGDPLFELDLRNFEAALSVAKASLKAAQEIMEDKKMQLSFYERVKDKRAVSEQEMQAAAYAYYEAAENVKVAEANVVVANTNIERSIVRAPIAGQILQVNVQKGEIAPIIPIVSQQTPTLLAANGSLILMGAVSPLRMRVDVDEEDSWRFKAGSQATAL